MFDYYINIPLNDEGIQEMLDYSETMNNVNTYELTEEQYLILRKKNGLFAKFDSVLGTIIDVCEEEVIPNESIEKAISIVNEHLGKLKNKDEIECCNIVRHTLELAKAYNTYWEIDIYLSNK